MPLTGPVTHRPSDKDLNWSRFRPETEVIPLLRKAPGGKAVATAQGVGRLAAFTPVNATTCCIIPDCRPLAATRHNTHSGGERKHIATTIVNHSLSHVHAIAVWFAQTFSHVLHSLRYSLAGLLICWLARCLACSAVRSLKAAQMHTDRDA